PAFCRPGGASTAGFSASRSAVRVSTSSSRLAERPRPVSLDPPEGWPSVAWRAPPLRGAGAPPRPHRPWVAERNARLGFSAECEIADVTLRSRRAAKEDSAVGDNSDLAITRDGEKVAPPIPIVEVKCPLVLVSGPSARSRKSLPRPKQARNY